MNIEVEIVGRGKEFDWISYPDGTCFRFEREKDVYMRCVNAYTGAIYRLHIPTGKLWEKCSSENPTEVVEPLNPFQFKPKQGEV